jgi:hypothetical protein
MNGRWALTATLLFAAGAAANPAVEQVARPSSGQRSAVVQPVNNGLPFQLICRGGPGLRVSMSRWVVPQPLPKDRLIPCTPDYLGGCARRVYDWSIAFSASSQPPDRSGRNLRPGECSPATFPWRSSDAAEIQALINDDGSLQGVELYPWERSSADANIGASKRTQNFLNFLKNPANYWSFQVQQTYNYQLLLTSSGEYDEGFFFPVAYSQYWRPEFYHGPTVTPIETNRGNQGNPYVVGMPPAPPAPDLDGLAARGEPIASQDALTVELRSRMPEGAPLRGFDIGMAAAEGNTAAGPGKQRIHDALSAAEQGGYDIAVSFSLQRNRNAQAAATGATIALADPDVAQARAAEDDVFYWLGFDIASGIFGDPAAGASGNTAVGPGALAIRNALDVAAQRGFNASVALHLSRNYRQEQ